MSALTPTRRDALRLGVGVVAAGSLLGACTQDSKAPPPPDPLAELAAQARADAATATAAAALPGLTTVATVIAAARTEHATVLQAEVDRERPPVSSSAPPPPSDAVVAPDEAAARSTLLGMLTAAEKKTGAAVAAAPRYRAGLLGSVAAGCAGLREVLG